MDERVRALWIEALESGEYSQTRGALQVSGHDWDSRFDALLQDGYSEVEAEEMVIQEKLEASPIGFCCLGVLCEIAIKDGLALDVANGQTEDGEIYVTYDDVTGTLPDRVREWAGLNGDNPMVEIDPEDYLDPYITKHRIPPYNKQGLVTLNDSFKWDFKKIAKYVAKL